MSVIPNDSTFVTTNSMPSMNDSDDSSNSNKAQQTLYSKARRERDMMEVMQARAKLATMNMPFPNSKKI